MRALVKSVVACTTRVTRDGSMRPASSRATTPAPTARAGSSWVVRTFLLHWRPADVDAERIVGPRGLLDGANGRVKAGAGSSGKRVYPLWAALTLYWGSLR